MTTAIGDHALGALCAALERDTAAEDALIAVAPRLTDQQIVWVWEVLTPMAALRWRLRCALAHEALQRVEGRAAAGHGTAALQQLATTLGLVPTQLVRLAQIHEVLTHSSVGPAVVAVLPDLVWYEEALAAPKPATALAYALDQVAAGRLYARATSGGTCRRS